jgi:hypothetical protein
LLFDFWRSGGTLGDVDRNRVADVTRPAILKQRRYNRPDKSLHFLPGLSNAAMGVRSLVDAHWSAAPSYNLHSRPKKQQREFHDLTSQVASGDPSMASEVDTTLEFNS